MSEPDDIPLTPQLPAGDAVRAILRRRQWLSIEEAAARVDEPQLRRLLERLPDLLDPASPRGESEQEERP